MVFRRKLSKGLLWIFLCYVSFHFLSSNTAFGQQRYRVLRQSVPWNPEGQDYGNYEQLKNDLIFSFKTAISRIIIASVYLNDSDLAAAAYSARARGIKVSVLLDKATLSTVQPIPSSGLLSALHPIVTKLNPQEMEGYATIVIDRAVWRFSLPLDDNITESLRIDRSPFTAPEVEEWVRFGTKRQVKKSIPSTADIPDESAKSPTTDTKPIKIFGNIKRRPLTTPSAARIPRQLPRETKWQKLKRGVDTEILYDDAPETDSQSHIPEPSSKESDLEE